MTCWLRSEIPAPLISAGRRAVQSPPGSVWLEHSMVNHPFVVDDPVVFAFRTIDCSRNSDICVGLAVRPGLNRHIAWRDLGPHKFREGMVVTLLHLLLDLVGVLGVFKWIAAVVDEDGRVATSM